MALWETEPGRRVVLKTGSRFWENEPSGATDLDRAVLCDECVEGMAILRQNFSPAEKALTLNRPDAIKLLVQVRRAPVKDQLDVLQWLLTKFPNHRPS